MGKISTEELFNRYFESVNKTYISNLRAIIDKPELYLYEKKIGKELIDMNVDELFGLIIELRNERNGKEIRYLTSHSSYDQFSSLLRSIFDYYIDNIQPIKNPLNDKRMKGRRALERLAQEKEPFRWSVVESVIKKMHVEMDEERADYVELALLLFYNGFSKAEEVVDLKADMINHHNKTVKLPNKAVPIFLSDRCYELLNKFNKLDSIPGYRGTFLLTSWHDSYFKFIIRPNQEANLNDRPKTQMCDYINRYITTNVNDKYNLKINYRTLYFLGFFEFIVGKHGEEKANKLLTSYRNSNDAAELMDLAREYGVQVDNVSHLKRELRPFISFNN